MYKVHVEIKILLLLRPKQITSLIMTFIETKMTERLTVVVFIPFHQRIQFSEVDAALNHLAAEADDNMSSYELALITLILAKRKHLKANDINNILLKKARNLPGIFMQLFILFLRLVFFVICVYPLEFLECPRCVCKFLALTNKPKGCL